MRSSVYSGRRFLVIYSAVMFITAAVPVLTGVLIYRGRTNLIHAYHQTRVTDRAACGKAAILAAAGAPLLSGSIGLLRDSDTIVFAAAAVLSAGTGIGFACLAAVQKKIQQGNILCPGRKIPSGRHTKSPE